MKNTDIQWRDDWNLFVEFLERKLQDGASQDDLDDCFGGREVCWTGTIEQIDFDELAAIVDVLLPERVVTLLDGSEVVLDGLTLAVSEGFIERWQHFESGDEITFTATLCEANSPFSPVELKTLESGGSIIMIRTSNASPA